MKIPVLSALAPLLILSFGFGIPVRAQEMPATPAPQATVAQAQETWGKARALLRGWKGILVDARETNNAGANNAIHFYYLAPNKARVAVQLEGVRAGRIATAVADGKFVSRLLPGASTYDRLAMKRDDDWDAVFGISPALLFSLDALLSESDLLASGGRVLEVSTQVDAAYRAQSVEEHGAQAATDWVHLRLNLVPGESKITDLVFGFTKSGLPRDFWMERPIGDALAVVHLNFVRVEPHPNFQSSSFQFTPPAGVTLAPKPGPLLPAMDGDKGENAAPQVSAEARVIFDRAADFYSAAKTLQLEARGSKSERTDGKEALPISLSLQFARPNKAKVVGENDAIKSLWLSDGKTVREWNDLLGDESQTPLKDSAQLREGMASTDYPVGRYLSGWLFGKHWLQPRELAAFIPGANYFKATALAPLTVKGQTQQRVQIHASYRGANGEPGLDWRHILYFRPDGALLRIEFTSQKGAVTTRGYSNVTSQTRDTNLPASTFVYSKPK